MVIYTEINLYSEFKSNTFWNLLNRMQKNSKIMNKFK